MLNLNWPVPGGDVFDGVFFVLSFFPRDVLDEIWYLIESVSESFPTTKRQGYPSDVFCFPPLHEKKYH